MEKLTKAESLFYANSMACIYIMQGYQVDLTCYSKECADAMEVTIYTDNEIDQCVIAKYLGERHIPNAKIEEIDINEGFTITSYVKLTIPFKKEK